MQKRKRQGKELTVYKRFTSTVDLIHEDFDMFDYRTAAKLMRVKNNDNELDIPEKFWYLATPYSKYPLGIEQAYLDAAKMTALLMEHKVFVFSPIVHTHTPAKYTTGNPLTSDYWFSLDEKYIMLSKGIIVCKMKGWEESEGIKKEVELANKLKLPVIYADYMVVPKLD